MKNRPRIDMEGLAIDTLEYLDRLEYNLSVLDPDRYQNRNTHDTIQGFKATVFQRLGRIHFWNVRNEGGLQ